ncbi:hypothetical protein KKE45_03710, partial [Patescibacteria group bacterium]|nr:hypothetical protein [Patescibacteria group bacterium]
MDITFLGVIASLLALILGLVVYFKGKNNPINLSLATYSLLSSVWCFSLYGYQNALFFSSFVWIKIVYALVFPMISACLYFSFVFPDKKTKKANLASILYWIIGIYFLYILVFTDKFVVKVFKTEWGYQTQLGFMYKYWGLYCSTTAVILINNLFQKYRKSKGYVRFQLKYIFLGLYIMAGGTLTIDVLLPVLTGNTKYFWASSLFSFPFIASTTYAMVKHRFLDIRFVIVKFISYLLLLTVLVTFYIGGNIFAKEILIFYFTLEQKLFISSLLGLVIVFSFLPLKNFLEKIVDQFFYKEKYNSEKLLKEMSQLMSSTLILKELTQKIIQKLINQMKITQVTLILISKNTTSVFSYPSKPVFRK